MLIGCERGITLFPAVRLADAESGVVLALLPPRCVGTGMGSEIGRKHGRGGLAAASRLLCFVYLTNRNTKYFKK